MSHKFARDFAVALFVLQLSSSHQASAEPSPAAPKVQTLSEFMAGETDADVPSTLPTPADADRHGTPAVYLIVDEMFGGDSAFRLDCGQDETVGSAMRKANYSRPIDFAQARIAVHRQRHNVKNDLVVEVEQEILPVEWDVKTHLPTAKTNHRLVAGDRIIVTPPVAVPSVAETPILVVAGQYYTPTSILPTAPPATLQLHPADAPSGVRYSAIPAAVPSPFADDQSPGAAPQAPIYEPQAFEAEPEPAKPSTVRFEVVVVEDLENSFAEFDQLTTQMPFMLADSSTIRGTLRILEKHELVKRLADPHVLVTEGTKGGMVIGDVIPEPDTPFQEFQMDVSGRQLGGGLAIEFGIRSATGRHVYDVRTSLIVPHGQTVVMKTRGQLAEVAKKGEAEKNKVEPAVYVVLTPEIVK